ncbi:MAG: hypothetical protein HUN04_14760 [Desulfobacter sp.]|nr:MAG: hypothetical protein HUN04_14760 [Desulfobacter sp.]
MERLTEIVDKLGIGIDTPWIVSALPSAMGARAGQQLNEMTVYAERLSNLSMPPDGEQALDDALRAIGNPMDNDASFQGRKGGCGVLTRAGWFNANPALVFFARNETKNMEATIMALAKEGWISQKTAPKAVLRFKKALIRQGIEFIATPILPLTRIELLDH